MAFTRPTCPNTWPARHLASPVRGHGAKPVMYDIKPKVSASRSRHVIHPWGDHQPGLGQALAQEMGAGMEDVEKERESDMVME